MSDPGEETPEVDNEDTDAAADDESVVAEVPDDLSGLDDLPPPPEGYGDDEALFVDGTVGRSDLAAERDEYRDALLRVKADFENYKKRIAKDHAATVERAAEKLVAELLPVLDACDAAIAQGAADVEPIARSLADILVKEGLERLDPAGQPFDPNLHEAVLHEPADGDETETIVTESMRVGYVWKGRVIRPAMVKVKG